MIKDSGERTEFEVNGVKTGAVRDVQEGKGRCDLMPLEVVAELLESSTVSAISRYKKCGNVGMLYACLRGFLRECTHFDSMEEMLLDAAIHFEEGAKKYGENNWQKGIPLHSYIDSAIRHYLKFRAEITDEPHGRAFVWNILCAIWTATNKPELNDFSRKVNEEAAVQSVVADLMSVGSVAEIAKEAVSSVSEALAKDHAEHYWMNRG